MPSIRASQISGIALLGVFAVVLPEASQHVVESPAYLPVIASFTIACDALIAALLTVRSLLSARPASAILGGGYAYVATSWAATLLALPGVFVPGQVAGNLQTSSWLGVGRFVVFALTVVAYALWSRYDDGSRRAAVMARNIARFALPAGLLGGLLSFWIAAGFALPPLVHGSDFRAFSQGIAPVLFVLTCVALVSLVFVRNPGVIARWVWVVTFAEVIELALSFFSQSRYTVAWYAGRGVSLAASLSILGVLSLEVVRLYGSLRVSEEKAQSQAREGERLEFIASISQALATTLDLDEMLDLLAHKLAPALGDRIAVFAFDDTSSSVGVATGDEADERDFAARMRKRGASGLLALLGAVESLEQRGVRFREAGANELVVPLDESGRVAGALICERDAAHAPYDDFDVRLADDVAARASLAIANVRVFERERRLADSLQRELLPATLPQLAGVTFDAVHESGSTEADIGGDWYDAFELPTGNVAFSIGGVAGRGLQAAVIMGRVRQAVRAFALADPDPRTIIERCNRLVRLDGAPMTSAIAGIVDPSTRVVTYANAGHPGPLVVAGGAVTLHEEARSLPLGLIENERIDLGTLTLAPGETLVLHTDGLIEIDHDVERGEAALREVLGSFDLLDVARPAAEISRRMRVPRTSDDLAILTIAVPLDRHMALDVLLPATPENSRSLRHSFRRVAQEAGISEDRTFAFEVAVGEAIANVIEHAYGAALGSVRLRAYSSESALVTEIIDYGRWRAPREEGRGHGMRLMRELSEGRVDVVRDDRSTIVRFRIEFTPAAEVSG